MVITVPDFNTLLGDKYWLDMIEMLVEKWPHHYKRIVVKQLEHATARAAKLRAANFHKEHTFPATDFANPRESFALGGKSGSTFRLSVDVSSFQKSMSAARSAAQVVDSDVVEPLPGGGALYCPDSACYEAGVGPCVHLAVVNRFLPFFKVLPELPGTLLQAGINYKDDAHLSTIHLACAEGSLSIVETLLKCEADVFAADEAGLLPLHHACVAGHAHIAKRILDEMQNVVGGTAGGTTTTGAPEPRTVHTNDRGAEDHLLGGQKNIVSILSGLCATTSSFSAKVIHGLLSEADFLCGVHELWPELRYCCCSPDSVVKNSSGGIGDHQHVGGPHHHQSGIVSAGVVRELPTGGMSTMAEDYRQDGRLLEELEEEDAELAAIEKSRSNTYWRTVGALLSVYWLACDRRDLFVRAQQEGAAVLSEKSWAKLRKWAMTDADLGDSYTLDALFSYLALKNLGRSGDYRSVEALLRAANDGEVHSSGVLGGGSAGGSGADGAADGGSMGGRRAGGNTFWVGRGRPVNESCGVGVTRTSGNESWRYLSMVARATTVSTQRTSLRRGWGNSDSLAGNSPRESSEGFDPRTSEPVVDNGNDAPCGGGGEVEKEDPLARGWAGINAGSPLLTATSGGGTGEPPQTTSAAIGQHSLLLQTLRRAPELFPSFARLDVERRGMVLLCLECDFQLQPFLFTEQCALAPLERLRNAIGRRNTAGVVDSSKALAFFVLTALVEAAGSSAPQTLEGSKFLDEVNYLSFARAWAALQQLTNSRTAREVMDSFLLGRSAELGLSFAIPITKLVEDIVQEAMRRVASEEQEGGGALHIG